MKYKNHVRIFGAYQTILSSAINAPLIHGAFFSDGSIYAKLGYGTMAVFCGLVTADGVVDMIKGTHHYLGLQIERQFEKIRGNQKGVDKLDSEMQRMLDYREQEHSIFRKKH
jgi:hypothetical protein